MTQSRAIEVLIGGSNVFLTGSPGSGKTYVLNKFIKELNRVGRKVAITATTGIAATHISGVTIHSWLGFKPGSMSYFDIEKLTKNKELIDKYQSTEVLIIDEVSMMNAMFLDQINIICQKLRRNSKSFGGLQIVLVGDLFQLPPVGLGGGNIEYIFKSSSWSVAQLKICYLTEQHRQSSGDELNTILESIRRGGVSSQEVALLKSRTKSLGGNNVISLLPHNKDVDKVNNLRLKNLNSSTNYYKMPSAIKVGMIRDFNSNISRELRLKIGARVMFIVNNSISGYVNGTIAEIKDFVDGLPLVKFLNSNGEYLLVSPYSWYSNELTISQIPLKLAWSVTIHKCQGMSLDEAYIDLSKSFTKGMGYVALSRLKSINGLHLGGLNKMALLVDRDVIDFDKDLKKASSLLSG